jgi:predicted dehydrogenase
MAGELKAAIVGCGRMGGFIDDEMTNYPDFVPPYCHAGAYVAAPETVLVAAADVVEAKLNALADRWNVPGRYTDYREMILNEKPDIVSVTTRPETHAAITIFAAENGVKGVYCEKPLCCSMDEADAMLEACAKHGVQFNLGVNRRYQDVFWKIREAIEGGVIGSLQSVSAYSAGSALWTHTHTTDMLLYLAGDPEVTFAQGHAAVAPSDFEDNRTENDPSILNAYFQFANGVHGTMTPCSGYEFEAHGSKGKIRSRGNGHACEIHLFDGHGFAQLVESPEWVRSSGAVNCVQDLAHAVLNGGTTRGNLHVSCRSQEMIQAVIESERLNGARVPLPMTNRALYIGRW